MKRLVVLLSIFFCLGVQAASNVTGRDAPPFSLPGVDGKPVNLADFKGKVVYVDFWASWCGPCRKSFGWLNEVQAKYGSQGFQVIGINLDEKSEDAQKFLRETPAKFAIAFDPAGKFPAAYGLKGMPTSYLIDRNGRVIVEHAGFKDGDQANLESKIRSALEGK